MATVRGGPRLSACCVLAGRGVSHSRTQSAAGRRSAEPGLRIQRPQEISRPSYDFPPPTGTERFASSFADAEPVVGVPIEIRVLPTVRSPHDAGRRSDLRTPRTSTTFLSFLSFISLRRAFSPVSRKVIPWVTGETSSLPPTSVASSAPPLRQP